MKDNHISSSCACTETSFFCWYLPLALCHHLACWQREITLNTQNGVFCLEINKQQTGNVDLDQYTISSLVNSLHTGWQKHSYYPIITAVPPPSHYKATGMTMASDTKCHHIPVGLLSAPLRRQLPTCTRVLVYYCFLTLVLFLSKAPLQHLEQTSRFLK